MTISADEVTSLYVYVCIYADVHVLCICVYINGTTMADCAVEDSPYCDISEQLRHIHIYIYIQA